MAPLQNGVKHMTTHDTIKVQNKRPLADVLRPKELKDVCGQQHILGEGKVFRRVIESGRIPNMIFYGPSGVGKTTVARIIAENSNMSLHKLNGTNAGTADIKAVISEIDTFAGRNGVILYLDEIQYLNKKQQQSLLESIENGSITLIASTTENPHFYIYSALLSRCTVFEFKALQKDDIIAGIKNAICKLNYRQGDLNAEKDSATAEIKATDKDITVTIEDDALNLLASSSGGDMRKALGALEFVTSALFGSKTNVITKDMVLQVTQKSSINYDKSDDAHYDSISALQKSIRGSDPDAAVHYLAKILEGGDMPSACRRLLVIAAEDIGLAYPMAITIVKACVDSAFQLGMPEARIPLAQAAILLATSPKSNSAYTALDAATQDIKMGNTGPVPRALQNTHFDGADAKVKGQHYKYPHAFENHWVKQQYLPDILAGKTYYEYGENKAEQAAKNYWDKIKK